VSLSELQGVKTEFVDTTEDALRFLSWLGERRPILAIDTETTGLKWWEPNFTRLVQFGDGMTGWALDARRWRGTIIEAIDKLRAGQEPTVWHNVKFDMHALEDDGFGLPDVRRMHDTKVMHHLLDNTAQHGLKPIADTYWLGASAGQQVLKKAMTANGWTWATVPVDDPRYWAYGALDTVLTARIAEKLWPQIAPFDEAYQIEMAAQMILYRAERRGMRIDPTYTSNLLEAWLDEAERLKTELLAYGVSNPSSNRAVAAALDVEGWEPEEWTETGLPKLDKVILAEVVARGGVPMEIASRVLRYKRIVKWSQSYLVKFLADRTAGDHVHASINTLAARTGRMSITGIPLQTLPRGPEVRHCVLPEEGHVLYAIDYDGQEARQFASLSNDPAFIQAFLDGLDVHRYTASLAYGVPMEDVTDDQRSTAKNTRYAQMYGAGAAKIAETAGVEVSVIEEFIRRSDAAFPGIPRFMKEVEAVGIQRMASEGRPYIVTLGGRHVGCEPDKVYKLVNCLIQGSAADLLKRKIVALDAAGLADYLVIPVHDEGLFTFPEGEAAALAAEAKDVMEDHDSYAVPLTCEATGPLPTWGTKYEKGH
jgi:DNA polymerase-1